MKIAVYPGSFDPITNGHIHVLKRALNVFDKVIVLVADNPNKKSKFTTQEKVIMIKEAIEELHLDGASVDSYSGLSVEYAKNHGAACLIRGLRAVTDFEYEFKLSAANHYIDSSIDEIFFMSHAETSFISSSVVDELYSSGVDISSLVPNSVIKMFKNK